MLLHRSRSEPGSMAAGSAGAVVHSAAMPVFFLLFSELVNGFGKNQHNLRRMTDEVSKYSLYFVYLGLFVCASSSLEIACWMYTGERQVGALRRRYLEAVLRQDVGFFDTDARTGFFAACSLLAVNGCSVRCLPSAPWLCCFSLQRVLPATARRQRSSRRSSAATVVVSSCCVRAAARQSSSTADGLLCRAGWQWQP